MAAVIVFSSCIIHMPQNARADYISKLDEVTIELSGCAAFYPDSSKAVTGNGIVYMSAPAYAEENGLSVPLDTLEELFGKVSENILADGTGFVSISAYADEAELNLYKDELTGLTIIGDVQKSYTWHENRQMLSGIIGQLIFDFPDASKIISDIEKHSSGVHPRILATKDTFDRIKNQTDSSSPDFEILKKHWLDLVEAERAEASAKDLPVYGPTDHIRMRQHSGMFYQTAVLNAFMYKLTGNEAYAKRAWKEIETISSDGFPDWNPIHLLDTGQFMNGMAVSYDWLYEWLGKEKREIMRRAMVDKGISLMCDVYDGKTVYSSWGDTPRSYPFYNSVDNWNFVCCGGALMAALAIFDDCTGDDRAKCERIMEESVKLLSYSAMCFSPSGDWYEGPAYWALANETMTEACVALQNSAGTDYGIMNAPGISLTCQVPFSLIGEYTFNYSNAGAVNAGGLPNTREMFYHAGRFNRDDYAKARFMLMDEYDITPDFRDLIYCTRSFESSPVSLNTDYYLKNSEVVTMRNADVEEGLIFAGLHGGANQPAQGHLDIGQFVIDSFGDRFASDLGLENYNLLVSYYHKYRNRAEGHNTLVINPDDRMYDQNLNGNGIIIRNEHNKASSIAVVDMTSAYTGYADSAVRGMKFINNRTSILIQDEVKNIAKKLNNENEIYWFMHTKADVTLKDNNRVAVLDINGNKMYATLLTDGEFGVMNAQPLPTSPNPDGQDANAEYQKLFIHLKNVTDANIAVCFTPGYYYENLQLPDVIPVSEWSLDTIGVKENTARLSSIKVNGEMLDNFNSDVFSYEYSKCETGVIPLIEASGNGEISTHYPDLLPATARITVTNGSDKSIYTISLSESKDKFENVRFKRLSVKSALSNVSDCYSTVDSNTKTAVSLKTSDYIVYELTDKAPVNYVSAIGDNLDLSVYYSEDGIDYEFISDISGTSEANTFTVSPPAKYIKLVSKSDDSVIYEFNAYGFDGYEYLSGTYNDLSIDFITVLYEKDNLSDKGSSLSFVNVKTANLSSEFDIFDVITVPDDGKKYEASVFIWIKDKLIPLMQRVDIN